MGRVELRVRTLAAIAVVGVMVLAACVVVIARTHGETNLQVRIASYEHRHGQSLARDLDQATDDLAKSQAALHFARRESARLQREVRGRQPCRGGIHLWMEPDHGPVGTRVNFVGDCFVRWASTRRGALGGYGIFLMRDFSSPHNSCEQIVSTAPYDLHVHNGRGRGYFTIGSEGGCFQTTRSRRVVPGPYRVGIGCHACEVTRFRVTQ